MTQTTPCPRCQQGTPDGLLCPNCLIKYARALAQLEQLLPVLGDTVAGQDNVARAIVHPAGPDTLAMRIEAEQHAVPAWLRSKEGRIALVPHAAPGSLDAADLLAAVRVVIAGAVTRLTDAPIRDRDPLARSQTAATRARAAGPTCDPHVHDPGDAGCEGCKQYHPQHVHRPARAGCPDDCATPFHCRHESCRLIRAGYDAQPGMRALHWLDRHGDLLRRSEHAPQIIDGLLTAARVVEEAVDSREADEYLGLCDSPGVVRLDDDTLTVDADGMCGTRLFVRPGEPIATCPICGWRYRVAERRRWLLNEARDTWMRPTQIAMAIAAVDLDLTAARLDTWISRDKKRHASRCWPGDPCTHILAVGLDSDEVDAKGRPTGRPLYRLGDVLDRVEALRVERAAKNEQEAQ